MRDSKKSLDDIELRPSGRELPEAMLTMESVDDWTPDLINAVEMALSQSEPLAVQDLAETYAPRIHRSSVRELTKRLTAMLNPSDFYSALTAARECTAVTRRPTLSAVLGEQEDWGEQLPDHLECWLVSRVDQRNATALAAALGEQAFAEQFQRASSTDPVDLVIELGRRTTPQRFAETWDKLASTAPETTTSTAPRARQAKRLEPAQRAGLHALYATSRRQHGVRRSHSRSKLATTLWSYRRDGIRVAELADATGVTPATVYLLIKPFRAQAGRS